MKEKDPNAVALGKRGGQSTSPAKVAAAKANGKKGGAPHKHHFACNERETCCICTDHSCFKGTLKDMKAGTFWRRIPTTKPL